MILVCSQRESYSEKRRWKHAEPFDASRHRIHVYTSALFPHIYFRCISTPFPQQTFIRVNVKYGNRVKRIVRKEKIYILSAVPVTKHCVI